MRIYVDFDDCLCETGRALSKLALEMFHKKNRKRWMINEDYGS